jgi:ABC-type glycerol-3-phosphate transport system substrate-binding protein
MEYARATIRRFRKDAAEDMKITRMFLLALAAVAVAGCSSGGSSGGGDGGGETTAGGQGVNGISVANCLNLEDFLVQPSETTLTGTSPGGVSFSLVFYKTNQAAKKAFEKKDKKTTALAENAVIDFKGNPSPYAGAPPAKISKTELDVIAQCIDENKEST